MTAEPIITVENLASCPAGNTARRGKRYQDLQWVVYAIRSNEGRIYIGQTGNFPARLRAHKCGACSIDEWRQSMGVNRVREMHRPVNRPLARTSTEEIAGQSCEMVI